jgi:hypothetical protein
MTADTLFLTQCGFLPAAAIAPYFLLSLAQLRRR